MGAPAEIPHADEDLKSLVVRFKESPGSSAFTELAAALLVRGHAAEALRIAEHGLQLMPQSVDGRIERAAALLALGRPRVAYVELKRALAINPTNRRAMRLLGKVYVDVGAPSRAAELLAQRFKHGETVEEEQEPTHVNAPRVGAEEHKVSVRPPNALSTRSDTEPLPKKQTSAPPPKDDKRAEERKIEERPKASESARTQPDVHNPLAAAGSAPKKVPTPQPSLRKEAAIPDLFSDLTRDLGLGGPQPEAPQRRVEVTQVIRRRGVRPRSPSELATIEGPIVDTTQPGQILEVSSDITMPSGGNEPPPMFDAVTSPRLQLAPFGLDDEPLFQEQMPFAVRPVEGDKETDARSDDPLGDLRETIDEESPPGLDSAVREAMADSSLPGIIGPSTQPGKTSGSGRFSEGGDTLVDQIEETDGPEKLPTSVTNAPAPPALNKNERTAEPADQVRFESGMPLLELSRPSRRVMPAPKLELVTPKAKPFHILLAIAGALFMIAWLALLLYTTPEPWAPKLPSISQDAPIGHAAPTEVGSK